MQSIDPAQWRSLSAAILSDVMDSLGLVRRAMRPFVRPADESCVLVGRARTGLYMPAYALRDGENFGEGTMSWLHDGHSTSLRFSNV